MTFKRLAFVVAAATLSLGLPPAAPAALAAPAAVTAVTWEDCTTFNNHPTWVHLDVYTAAGLVDWCYGGKGTVNLPAHVAHMCSGNNSGIYYYKDLNGVLHHFNFGPGQDHGFSGDIRSFELTISGWTGHRICVS